jgi:PAS domain S-box-containing protein
MKRLSIGYKIFFGFLILIVLSASFLLISFPSLTTINILSSQVVPLSREMDALQRYNEKVKHLQTKIELYFTIKSEESREEVIAAVSVLNDLVRSVRTKEETPQLQDVSDAVSTLAGATTVLMSYMDTPTSTYRINLQIIAVNELFEEFEDKQEAFQRDRLRKLQAHADRQINIISALLDRYLVIEISIIFFGFLASFFLSRIITRDLDKLQRGTRQIASGNFDARIDISSKDEIGELARSFNAMASELKTKTVSKEYVDNIIRNMADALLVTDPDLKIRSVNRAACILLGYEESELIEQPLEIIFSQSYNSLESGMLERIKEGKLIGHEIDCRSKDGRDIPVLFSVAVMKDAYDVTICIICTASDITTRKKAEEELREAMEMKTKFTAMVSHELRTPLAGITTGVSLVTDGLAGEINQDQKTFLDIVRRNVDRLGRLVNDILDFQKFESGKIIFRMEENNINDIAREAQRALNSLAKERDLEIRLNLDESLPRVRFDRDRILQVFGNLLNNAIKFTRQGSVSITTARDNDNIRVTISDSGIGIKPEDIPKLFRSFEQLDRGRSGKVQGTGLGLAICREIIDRHKGKIWAESSGEGTGASFIFILPIQDFPA